MHPQERGRRALIAAVTTRASHASSARGRCSEALHAKVPYPHRGFAPARWANGRRFKSFSVEDGRFRAQVSDPQPAESPPDSRYVQRVPGSWCVW
jgi:hypothetical protein